MRLIAVGLLTGSGLFLEITLTRILSTLYYPPFVFVVISLAILGIGLGAALASARADLRKEARLPIYHSLAGASTLVVLAGILWLSSTMPQFLLVFIVVLPFVFIGLALSVIFSITPDRSTVLYMADLGGAGIGAIVVLPILNMVEPLNAMLLVSVAFGLSALAVHPLNRSKVLGITGISIILFASNMTTDWISIDIKNMPTEKPLISALSSGKIIETRWDSFARTDLVAPNDGGPYQLFVDGAAGSIMPPAQNNQFLIGDIGFFPFATNQPRKVLVIGPGGGLDVWFGLKSNAQSIRAIEVNPASVDLVQQYADYTDNLYGRSEVELSVDEGRSVLRRENTRYDLIFLSQVITETAERSGYALTENTIYTVEAFEDYLSHLTPNGQLALKLYDELTLTRALTLAMAALQNEGKSDKEALKHIAVFIDPQVQPPVPLLLVNKSPFTRENALSYGAVAREVGFIPLFLPGILSQTPLDQVESGQMTYQQVIAESEQDISPTTDNRPFFFQFERGLPSTLQTILVISVVIISIGAVSLIRTQRRMLDMTERWSPLFFAGLGVGFIFIEIAIIQQTRIYLGHPTIAITTIIGTFLIVGGIGSLLAGKWIEYKPGVLPMFPAIFIVVAALIWIFIWNRIESTVIPAQLTSRVMIVVMTLIPLALAMGMPFPLGLRAFTDSENKEHLVAITWAVNGVMTVIGAIGAVALSILWGYNSVLYTGIIVYALIAFISVRTLFRVRHAAQDAPLTLSVML